MAVSKVALSLPGPLLTRIDRLAKSAGVSRSALVRQVMEAAIHGPAQSVMVRKARRIYAEIEKSDQALSATFLQVAAETLPSRPKPRGR